LKISTKLYTGFAVVTLLAMIISIVGVTGMQRLRISGADMYERQVVGIEHAGKALSVFEEIRLDYRSVVIHSLYDDIKAALDVRSQFENNVSMFRELMEICKELVTTDELLNFYDKIMDLFENLYLPYAEQIIEKSINDIPDHNNRLHIYVMLAYNNDTSNRLMSLITGMIDLNVAISRQTSADNQSLTRGLITALIILSVSGVIFAFLITYFIVKGIQKPIVETAVVLEKIASGDFDAKVSGYYNDEFSIIKDSINVTATKLKVYTEGLETATKKAQAASKAKSNFLANMSHEMRTPLNAIIGMTLIGKKTQNPEEREHALNKIGDASSHMLDVVNDILDMAKIETDKMELASVEFNFEQMIEKVISVIRFRADEKQQVLKVTSDKNIPHIIIGDDVRLAQVITNLLSNAVKFTPEKGKIDLTLSFITENNEYKLYTEVSDTGIGISQEMQERLFVAFEQAESGTSRVYGGTGLGLSITKHIIDMMNGKIWVESKINEGSKFSFIIPVFIPQTENENTGNNEKNDYESTETNTKNLFKDKYLLLAEDVEINREILIVLLGESGISIDCAENGKIALEMIAADPEKYDIVFMDLQMPVMDGIEATKQIRALPERKRGKLPIVAMTANIFKEDIEACIAAGMDDHLGKPLDLGKVVNTIQKFCIN